MASEAAEAAEAAEATMIGLVTLVVGTNNSGKTILLERVASIRRLLVTPEASPKQRGVKFAVSLSEEEVTAELNSPAIQDSGFQRERLALPAEGLASHRKTREILGTVVINEAEPCVTTGRGKLGVHIQRKGDEVQFTVPQWTKRAAMFFDDGALQRLDAAKAASSKHHDAYLRRVFEETGMEHTKLWFREILSKQLEVHPPHGADGAWKEYDGRNPELSRFHFTVKSLTGEKDSNVEYAAQEMGMGARSLLGVLLFLERNKGRTLLCVDEPAQFLHPRQAELLGAMISKYAIENECHVFVSTHSLPLMRGLMGTVLCDGAVVDMINCNDDNLGYVSEDRVQELCSYGHVVTSGLLEAFSHHRVVITENYKDSLVYMAATPMVCPDVDVLWLGGGGAGEATTMLQLARRLGIHAVALLDYDQLKLRGFCKMTPQCADYAEKQTREGLPGDKPPPELTLTESLQARVTALLAANLGGKKLGVQWLKEYIETGEHEAYFHELFHILAQVAAETAGGVAIVPFGALEQMVVAGAGSKSSSAGCGHAQHMGRLSQRLDRCSVMLRKVLDKAQERSGQADDRSWPQPAALPKCEFAALYPQITCMIRMVMWMTSPDRLEAYAAVQSAMQSTADSTERSNRTSDAVHEFALGTDLVEECLGGSLADLAQSNPSRRWLGDFGAKGGARTADRRAAELGFIGQVEKFLKSLLSQQQTAEDVASWLDCSSGKDPGANEAAGAGAGAGARSGAGQ